MIGLDAQPLQAEVKARELAVLDKLLAFSLAAHEKLQAYADANHKTLQLGALRLAEQVQRTRMALLGIDPPPRLARAHNPKTEANVAHATERYTKDAKTIEKKMDALEHWLSMDLPLDSLQMTHPSVPYQFPGSEAGSVAEQTSNPADILENSPLLATAEPPPRKLNRAQRRAIERQQRKPGQKAA